jgi:hypothetical protein
MRNNGQKVVDKPMLKSYNQSYEGHKHRILMECRGMVGDAIFGDHCKRQERQTMLVCPLNQVPGAATLAVDAPTNSHYSR